MKRVFVTTLCLLSMCSGLFAVLPPLYQSIRERQVILESPELGELLGSAEFIEGIVKTEEGYMLVTTRYHLPVAVTYEPVAEGLIGPGEPVLEFGEPIDVKQKPPQADARSSVVDHAKAKLVGWLLPTNPDVDADDIMLISITPTTWRNGALGCAEPGKYYTMALVPGFIIKFEYEGAVYTLHTNGSGSRVVSPDFMNCRGGAR